MKEKMLELLESIELYLPKLVAASANMAEDIQAGNEGQAFVILKDYIEGMMWLTEAISTIKSINSEYLATVNLEELTGKLRDLEQAMSSQDYVLLADILEYEIQEILKDYLSSVVKFKVEIQNG